MLLAPGKYHKNFQSSRFHAGGFDERSNQFFCLKYVLFTMVSVIAQESAHAQSKASVLRSHICIWIHRGGVTCVHNRRQAPKHPHNFRSTLGPVQKRPRNVYLTDGYCDRPKVANEVKDQLTENQSHFFAY